MSAAQHVAEQLRLSQVLAGLIEVSPAQDVGITGITADSRRVKAGDLFVAYRTAGKYIADAIRAGATAVIVEAERAPALFGGQVPILALATLRDHAGEIAAKVLDYPTRDLSVIGVTGTNGKTTVSHLIAGAMYALGRKSSLMGTLGYGVWDHLIAGPNTTPEAITLQRTAADLRRRGAEQLVLEVSSHGLDQARVGGVEFDSAVLTNVSRDHLDYHQTEARYAASKRRLFSDYGVRRGVFNIEDPYGLRWFGEFGHRMEVIGYTLQAGGHDRAPVVVARIVQNSTTGMVLDVTSPWGHGTLTTPLVGRFNAANLLAALATVCLSGVALQDALASLSTCVGVSGRMELIRRDGQPTVVVDYAHTPDALAQALTTLRPLAGAGQLICVFGCGGERDIGKRPEMGRIAALLADRIFLTNDNPRGESPAAIIADIRGGIGDESQVTIEPDRQRAIYAAIGAADDGDIVVVAGKGHETTQEIAGHESPWQDRRVCERALDHARGGEG